MKLLLPKEIISSDKGFINSRLDTICNDSILFVSDEQIWKNCAKFFPKNFLQQKNITSLILREPKADDKNLGKISAKLKNHSLILALGSGTVNDLCKYISAQKNIPYIIIPSAASMNGYLSKNASITILGHKKTLSATLAQEVWCDLNIIKAAPSRLNKAGIGDLMCFYSCWFDWYLSHKAIDTKFDPKPFRMLQPKMEFLIKNFSKFSFNDKSFLKLLMEILFLSGRGMTIASGSYPASQSEHMIAHTIDMKYSKIVAKKLHGEMIAVTTITASEIQQQILQLKSSTNKNFNKTRVLEFFGKKIGNQCWKEYKEKQLFEVKAIDLKTINSLEKIHLKSQVIQDIFKHFDIKYSYKSLGLKKQQYEDCVSYAKFIRNRFTCLDFISYAKHNRDF